MEALAELYLDELDVPTRIVVDAASTIRRSTRSLLGALLDDGEASDAFDRLRGLPFVELTADGLHLHDTVQQTAAEMLRATDPVRYRTHRRAAWRQLRHELAGASQQEGVSDAEAIRSIIERHDRPGRADALQRWWERLPHTFSVARDRSGQVVGFDTAFEYRDARPDWLHEDPITRRWIIAPLRPAALRRADRRLTLRRDPPPARVPLPARAPSGCR